MCKTLWIQAWESAKSPCYWWKYHGRASKSRIYHLCSISEPMKSSLWEGSQGTDLWEIWRKWAWNLPQVDAFLQFPSVLCIRESEACDRVRPGRAIWVNSRVVSLAAAAATWSESLLMGHQWGPALIHGWQSVSLVSWTVEDRSPQGGVLLGSWLWPPCP